MAATQNDHQPPSEAGSIESSLVVPGNDPPPNRKYRVASINEIDGTASLNHAAQGIDNAWVIRWSSPDWMSSVVLQPNARSVNNTR